MTVKTNQLLLLLILLISCSEKSSENQVVDWISNNAIEIKTVEAGNGIEDLLPIGEIVGDARMVSLGEPTHGNREVFQLKHRMIEYLVQEKGFNIFALECPFGAARDINRYVLDGIGDPEKALAGTYMWSWETKEVLDLIVWMREYNSNPDHKKKVKFYGFDPQHPERAARVMLEYLAEVDPALEKKIRPELGILEIPFSNPEFIGIRQWIPEDYNSSSFQNISLVMDSFDKNKDQYVQNSSDSEWKLAKQHARQVEIVIKSNLNEGENFDNVRDLGQAQNLKWIMDHEGKDAKMITWAHNTHVSNASFEGVNHMGLNLKKMYGDDLKIFGFFFNQGDFRAIDLGVPSKGIHDFSVGPAPAELFEYTMAQAKMPLLAIDLSKIKFKSVVYDWFNQERGTRHSGGSFNEEQPFYWPYNLANAYDALIYLDSTSAVVDIDDSDHDHMWLNLHKMNQPTNTDFENNRPGETADGWVAWSKFVRLGVNMTISDEDPYKGKHSAMLHREEGLKYGEITASLRQYIDASPYRGKTIRLKLAAKAEVDESNFAFVRLSVDPDHSSDPYEVMSPLFDSLDKYRVHSSAWKTYEIETEVDEKADMIHYGIYLRDFGTAWIDDVKITIVE
ncbi:MAG: erythromycin esterase family protein [Maribacter sp.]|uniref:erythromycin esterase family protein n=1 Tax=Maribacter sp. TaxID=1897614 RepID=UPI003298DDF2